MPQFNKLGIDNDLGASNDINMTIVLPANHKQGRDWLPKSHSSSQGHCLHTFSWHFKTITGNMKQSGAATTMLGNKKLKHCRGPNTGVPQRGGINEPSNGKDSQKRGYISCPTKRKSCSASPRAPMCPWDPLYLARRLKGDSASPDG